MSEFGGMVKSDGDITCGRTKEILKPWKKKWLQRFGEAATLTANQHRITNCFINSDKALEGIAPSTSRSAIFQILPHTLFCQTDKASPDEVEEFLSEISMMKRVGRHTNVVIMLGCCTLKQPYCMLMEYVPCGDLLQYLRQLRVEYERRTGGAFVISSTMQRPTPRYVELQHHSV